MRQIIRDTEPKREEIAKYIREAEQLLNIEVKPNYAEKPCRLGAFLCEKKRATR